MPSSRVVPRIPSDLSRLSIVVPAYGSPESLAPLRDRVSAVCAALGVDYELILVDDRCPKRSWAVIAGLAAEDAHVVGLRLSRNFGQHAAIQAGLAQVTGDWIVVMDCDLQDRPEEIPHLLARAADGFDIVRARRAVRRDRLYRRLASSAFYVLLSYLTDTEQSAGVANFGVYRRKVIDAIASWREETKYFPAIVQWIGFSTADIDVTHDARYSGKSSYTFAKLFRLASQVVIGFSDKPLRLIVGFGLSLAALAIAVAFALVLGHFAGQFTVEGWASVILSVWFLGGAMLCAIGLTGLYVGRILVEVKDRPTFVVDETVGGQNRSDGLVDPP